jgi:hypothetical protein
MGVIMTIAWFRLATFGCAVAVSLAVLAPDSVSAQGYDRRLVIINETGRTVREIYATNSGTKNWGRDHLGQNVIPRGGRYLIDFNDGTGYCVFDFRAVLDNGIPIERYQVNVCTDSTWVVR